MTRRTVIVIVMYSILAGIGIAALAPFGLSVQLATLAPACTLGALFAIPKQTY